MHRLCETLGLDGTAIKEIQGGNNKHKYLLKIAVTGNYQTFFYNCYQTFFFL